MNAYSGTALSWELRDSVVEVSLHREPANEIGTAMLSELENLVEALRAAESEIAVCIFHSTRRHGFSAGADLRELYQRALALPETQRLAGVRGFLERIHAVLNFLDAAPFATIAAVHGVCFGGGFELALACDLIFADKMARFAFPEMRLGLIPGFGGIPRLKRDLGNALVRDLLLTGRSINAARAHAVGLVAQLAAEGEVLRVARSTAAQISKFDPAARGLAKRFIKAVPHGDLRQEIEIFSELFSRPTVMAALKKFVESTDAMPYLP
jgi:enoyl-CoA hydratase